MATGERREGPGIFSRTAAPAKPPRPPMVGVASDASGPDDLDDPTAIPLAVELEEHHALPGAEAELAVAHRDRLARGPEQHRHAVRMPVAEVHVLGADVLGAAVPVVVRVVGVARDQTLEHVGEVIQEAALELVHAHAAGRVRRVDAGDPVDNAALADDLDHFLGDVADRQSAAGSKLRLLLEDLHLALTLLRLSAAADVRAEHILRVSRASWKSKVLIAGRVGGRRLGRAGVHVLARGAATSGTAAADRDRALHAQVLVPIDRAVDLVGAGLRKRDLQGAAASRIDGGDV